MDDLYSSVTKAPLVPGHEKCDRYYTSRNHTYFIYGGYEGIPETLLLNVIVWFVLLVTFAFLRKIAWDYGRLALVSRTEARALLPFESRYNVWTSLFYGDHSAGSDLRASQESLDTQVHRQDKGFCAWIPAFLRIKDEHILQKSGRDAVQYLTFQRYMIVYMGIVTVLCIAVVLPVNFQGDLEGDMQTFGHTTISNLQGNSSVFWLHVVLAVLFLVIIVLMMRHFSVNLQYQDDEQATRTLMVFNIPKHRCFKNIMQQHFQEAYPEAPVEDIQFAYNISKLAKLDKKRQQAYEGMVNSEAIFKSTSQRPTLFPYPCGQCCCCCQSCGCVPVDAIEYYSEQELKYRRLCEQEKVDAFQDALGIAFITFENDHIAARVQTDFKVSCKGVHNPHPSSVSRELSVHNWEVTFAPSPDDIYWHNLSVSPAFWWSKAIVVNFVIFLLLFFLTTPSIFLNLLNKTNYTQAAEDLHTKELQKGYSSQTYAVTLSPLLVQFVPTLLLWAISALLPTLVYYSDQIIGHWTRTAQHHAVMRKTFGLLVMMVLVLPSLGLTSAKALLEWIWSKKEYEYKFRWQCIFLPDNGAFFVNYVITSAFIGSALELIRFPELFMYAMRLACAKSSAERTSVRKAVLWEFQFGLEYAWMLSVTAVIMAYSIPCPLITPFGLMYLIFKHLVDRYNIYFAYGPSRIDKNIHASAINFVIVAVILLQASMVFFIALKAYGIREIIVFSIVSLFVTLIIFCGRVFFGWFKWLSPISYKQFDDRREEELGERGETDHKPFVPKVLLEDGASRETDNGVVRPSSQPQGYGATETPITSPEHTRPDS